MQACQLISIVVESDDEAQEADKVVELDDEAQEANEAVKRLSMRKPCKTMQQVLQATSRIWLKFCM